MKARLYTLILLSIPVALHAQLNDENERISFRGANADVLVQSCKAVANLDAAELKAPRADASKIGLCLGFVAGVADMSTLENGKPGTKALFCLPLAASGLQLAKVVAKYGENHPEQLDMPGVAFVASAFVSAYPCH